jgi:hypothetical protein
MIEIFLNFLAMIGTVVVTGVAVPIGVYILVSWMFSRAKKYDDIKKP